MSEQIANWMSLYELSPTLKLYDDMIDEGVNIKINGITKNTLSLPNPIEVVLESLLNILSENMSIETLTSSKDKIYLTKDIQNNAMNIIIEFTKTDKDRKLKHLHDLWIYKLIEFLQETYELYGNLKTDDVLYRISNKFRLSGTSATKAILSITSINIV